MNELRLSAKIEAILFYRAEPVSARELVELLSVAEEEVKTAIEELSSSLSGRGITLIAANGEFMLGTSPHVSELIERLRREEIARDLGKAGLETLAIVLYKGPVARKEIDYIRGVNSTFILRSLLVRGLVERVEGGARGFLYQPTVDLLAHMGLSKIEDLPEYENVRREMQDFSDSALADAQAGTAAGDGTVSGSDS